ncbi:MAG: cyclic nucleotide-binding and patatin-like phospholipase domain-containing protein, partial [Planctomycetota bacterium]
MTQPHPYTQDHAATAVLGRIFGKLPPAELESLFEHLQPAQFNPGDTIVEQGDAPDVLHFVVTGRARVWTSDEDARTMMTIGPGDPIGASHVLAKQAYSQSITALTYLETFGIPAKTLRDVCDAHPEIYEVLCRTLSRDLVRVGAKDFLAGRELHSLAIILADQDCLPVARSLIDRLHNDDAPIRPMWLVESETDRHPAWTAMVNVNDLGMEVASTASRDQVSVVLAAKGTLAESAANQCDRMMVIGHHTQNPRWLCDLVANYHKERSTLVRIFPSERESIMEVQSDLRPSGPMAEIRIVCDETRVSVDGIERLHRSLRGRRVGLALGGGGARGIAHIGVLQVFAERGLVFDSVAGTSAGAIIGAAYAAGFDMHELANIFREEFTPPRWLRATAAGRRFFLLKAFRGGRVANIFARVLGETTFDDLRLPLSTTSVDLISGNHVIHREGRVMDAVLASINHPAFGRPIIRDGKALVDGGVLMNVPATALTEDDCDLIVSVDVGSQLSDGYAQDAESSGKSPGFLATMVRTIDVAQRHA